VSTFERVGTGRVDNWTGLAVASALALGVAVGVDVRIALALAIALILGLVLVIRPTVLLPVLVASIFVEVVSLGGVTISRLLAPLALLAMFFASTRPGFQLRASPPLFWATAYGLWALASGLWSVRLDGTFFLLGSLAIALVYMLAFATVLSTRRQLEDVLYVLAFASLGIGLFAIGAFLLGYADQLLEGRASGGTGDPNFFAAYQLVALPLVLVMAVEARRRWLRLLLYATVLVIIASVLTSVSRGGVLTLVALTALMVVLPARTLFRSPRQKAIVLLAVVVGGAFALKAGSDVVVPRLTSIFDQSVSASSEGQGSGRLEFWAAAGTSIRERPVFGLGYGAFGRVSNELILRTPGIQFSHFELRPTGSQAHSAYLGTTAELGVIGLVLFLGLLLSTALALRRTARRARETRAYFVMRVANALLLSLVGWSIASLFLSSETSRGLWIVVGMTLALPKLISGRPLAQTARTGLPAPPRLPSSLRGPARDRESSTASGDRRHR
jgi:putative inorganic carbon (hco3(-)) transporter